MLTTHMHTHAHQTHAHHTPQVQYGRCSLQPPATLPTLCIFQTQPLDIAKIAHAVSSHVLTTLTDAEQPMTHVVLLLDQPYVHARYMLQDAVAHEVGGYWNTNWGRFAFVQGDQELSVHTCGCSMPLFWYVVIIVVGFAAVLVQS